MYLYNEKKFARENHFAFFEMQSNKVILQGNFCVDTYIT